MSETNTSSAASTTVPKASIFAAKSGFVIPKNKLSGSLVPIFRGGKKSGGYDAANEDSRSQVLRKTKWGPDPNQDAAVRRGRALAYQTRVDQIIQQLKSRTLEPGGTQEWQLAYQHGDPKSSNRPIDAEDSEHLKLERCEIIGEILKLNPTYEAPPGYEPLPKEATFPIPIKDHPGYNFVSLIFGPGGETQKRLEKETGAKIQICGIKANTGEKVEISPPDGNENLAAYDELNFHVLADTFEKVDGAVALIEMLITSISGNLVAGNKLNDLHQIQETRTPFIVPISDQGVIQSVIGPTQTPQQGQFQYQGPRLPVVSAQAVGRPPAGFITLHNSSPAIYTYPLPVHSSPLNPAIMSFGSQPIPASGFTSILQNTSLVPSKPHLPIKASSHPYLPRNFPMPTPQPLSAESNILASLPSTGNEPPPDLPSPVAGPLVRSLPLPVLGVQPRSQPDRPLTPMGSSFGWSAASGGVPSSIGPGNIMQMVSPMVSIQGSPTVVPQLGFQSSVLTSSVPAADIISPLSFSSALPTINVPMNHPTGTSSFPSVPPSQEGSGTLLIQSWAAPVPHVSIKPISGSTPISSPMISASQPTLQSQNVGSFSGNTAYPAPVSCSVATPIRPLTIRAPKSLSGPGDFTFQPHQQNSIPRPSDQPISKDCPLPRPLMRSPSSQTQPFRLAVPNSIPPPGMYLFPRPPVGNQIDQPHALMSALTFAGNSVSRRVPPFSHATSIRPSTRNFSPVPQLPDLAGPFPLRPGIPRQVWQNYPTPIISQGNFVAPNHQPSINLSLASSPGRQQIYDPFSPTSVPIMTQLQEGNMVKGRKQKKDPEYDDSMASVGV